MEINSWCHEHGKECNLRVLILRRERALDHRRAARFAAAASISVTRAGAQPSMPAMQEVEQVLAQAPTLMAEQHSQD
jgi:sugar/nucleoside kinase (ribokinase family)